MSVLRILVCVAVVCIVPTVSQRLRFPSQVEIKLAIENPNTVEKALRCIEGFPCKLPYGNLLRRAGPELMIFGRCPRGLCTRQQEEQARKLLVQIQNRYPRKFQSTVTRISQSRFG